MTDDVTASSLFAAFAFATSFDRQLPVEKLDLILRRHDEINGRLAANPDSATVVALSREPAGLEDITTAIRAYRGQAAELDGIDAMLDDPALDAEMRTLTEEERRTGTIRGSTIWRRCCRKTMRL